MMKRRQILLGCVGTGIVATVGSEYEVRQEKKQLIELAEQQEPQNPQNLLKAAFEADAEKIYEGESIIRSLKLSHPHIPYNSNVSKRLIRCSKIATQQYLTGKTIPTYDGRIETLPAYDPNLKQYQQIAAFRGKEAQITQPVEVEMPTTAQKDAIDPVEQNLGKAENQIDDAIKMVVKLKKEIPVYYGFVLSSPTENIMVFRGTQTSIEWLNNLTAIQTDYTDPVSGKYFGKIHEGFLSNYKRIIAPIPRDVAKTLNPNIPFYITGHSLGSSLAILAALDIALNVPQLASQIRLYTYASPRIGDVTFAQLHSQTVPNSYRVVNLADAITLLPPTKLRGIYVHVGQEWSFLSQGGDFMPNHVVDTYETAVNIGVETHQLRHFPVTGLS